MNEGEGARAWTLAQVGDYVDFTSRVSFTIRGVDSYKP